MMFGRREQEKETEGQREKQYIHNLILNIIIYSRLLIIVYMILS